MSGFPAVPARAAFGPTFQNARPVRDATRELDAGTMNLAAWQVAGAGRTVPKAWLLYAGATPALSAHAETWAPSGDGAAPGAVRNSTGNYTFTYLATYPDENGAEVPFAPQMAVPVVQGGAAGVEATATISGQTVTVLVKDAAAASVNATVFVLVW